MSRLIDGDALLEYLDKRRTYEVMDGRNKAYGKGVRDAMKDIESAPTIDAIPVGWLKAKRVTHPTTDAEILHNSVIRAVLVMWEREQEPKEG